MNPMGAGITTANPKGINSPNPTAGLITPASPSATVATPKPTAQAAAPVSTASPVARTLPPAGQDYASNLAGITSGLQNLQTGLDTYKQNQAPQKKDSEYLKYLRSMFNPEEARRAQENVNKLTELSSQEISANRKEQERIQKNEAGVVERGQTFLSQSANRESSKALADLAIAKGYNTDILNQYTAAGKSLYEAEQAAEQEANTPLSLEEAQTLGVPFGTTVADARKLGIIPSSQSEGFSLSEGQARYDAQGNLIASRGKTYAPKTETPSTAVIPGVDIQTSTAVSNAKNAITQARKYMGGAGAEGTFLEGIKRNFGSTDASNLKAQTNTIKTTLLVLATDPNIKKFFGPAMSNADVQLMTSLAASLDSENMSPDAYELELDRAEALMNKFSVGEVQPTTQSTVQTPAVGESLVSGGITYVQGSDGLFYPQQ